MKTMLYHSQAACQGGAEAHLTTLRDFICPLE